jgi:hypothetical protein
MKTVDAFSLAAVPILSVAVYAAALLPLRVEDNSSWYWLPRGLSLCLLVTGLTFASRRAKLRWYSVIIAIALMTLLVLAGDLVVSVAYSCSLGRCL